MEVLLNLTIFGASCVVMWLASGLIIHGIERLARNIRVSSFMASLMVLGILTSIPEISVGLNSIIDKKPDIFVGNLIGASMVLLLCIIPLLAILNNGIVFKQYFDTKKILFYLVMIAAPSLIILDGEVSRYDGLLLILLYGFFFYIFRQEKRGMAQLEIKKLTKKATLTNLAKIIAGAVLIYLASRILVEETIYFAQLIKIPTFVVSLLLLSVGTNLPELTIAFNSAAHKKNGIAFGDYIGSAAANTLIFGVLSLAYGSFHIDPNGFRSSVIVMLIGYVLFFFFFRSKNKLSSVEGIVLLLTYVLFLLFQGSETLMRSTVI